MQTIIACLANKVTRTAEGKITIEKLFERFNLPAENTTVTDIPLFARFVVASNDARKDYNVVLIQRYEGPVGESEEVARIGPASIPFVPPSESPNEPWPGVDVHMLIQLTFPKFGQYYIDIVLDGNVLTSIWLYVAKKQAD